MIKTEIVETLVKQNRVIECCCDICGEKVSFYYDHGVYRASWNLVEYFDSYDGYIVNDVRYHFCAKCIEEKIEPLLKKE